MLSYVIRRLLLMIPTLIGITAVVFFTMALSPGGVGGPALASGGELESGKTQALRAYYERRYGLDEPLWRQYLNWLGRVSPLGPEFTTNDAGETVSTGWGLKVPDLGRSFSKGRPVLDLYGDALPITLLLNAVTLPFVYGIAIVSGVYAARFRGRTFDVASGTVLIGLWSIPTIWAGVMLIGFFANSQYPSLWLFPTGGLSSPEATTMPFLPRIEAGPEGGVFVKGWLLDRMHHLVLPVICLSYGSFAVLSKLMRASVLENISSHFIRTARAKGLPETQVLWGHAFRNSLLPLITVSAGILPGLLGGSVVVEKIFSINGMGLLVLDAIYSRDRDVVLAGTLIAGVLTLICILIADLLYAIADPRVSYD